jgi:PRTRC genetic system protein E
MQFFQLLNEVVPSLDITLRLKEKAGKLTISITNNAGASTDITPLIVTGTPHELDSEFFNIVAPVIADGSVKLVNLAEHKKAIDQASAAEEKANEEVKDKPAEKKASPEKKKSPAKSISNEPDLFAMAAQATTTTGNEEEPT